MKFTLNPYALVIEAEGTINFILSDHTNPVKLVLNEKQSEVLSALNGQVFTTTMNCVKSLENH